MELAYLYIEEYRNLKDVEINFTQQVHIEYDKKQNVLICNKKESLIPEGFWKDNIRNLAMIVGNNGAGKTSLMQYVISICEDIVAQKQSVDYGILVLKDGNRLFCYETAQRKVFNDLLKVKSNTEFSFKKKNYKELRNVCEKTKVIYLTNAISYTDYKRNERTAYDRFSLLYDCSMGGLMYLDSAFDVNRNLRQNYTGISELENYYIYEKYKQVKFVFDEKQYAILEKLRKDKYSVPVPETLYINFFLDNQLKMIVDLKDKKEQSWDDLDRKLFPQETSVFRDNLTWGRDECINEILHYQFCRCCIWGMVRSINSRFDGIIIKKLIEHLGQEEVVYEEEESEFCQAIEYIWRTCEKIVCEKSVYLKDGFKEFERTYKKYYLEFIEYIEYLEEEELSKHFRVEEIIGNVMQSKWQEGIIRLSISVSSNEVWFSNFLKKYRYTSNPDYYLDFDWGLSSGETNLLSTFALFYCIFAADYTNEKNGEYKIYNKWERQKEEYIQCDSVIILADEVDLTFHPEWQRQYISLLTAFLSRVYPSSCCKNIQLILSTHSPILLSDIPQQNVIYLKLNEEKKVEIDDKKHIPTFGQNIHLLFKDSFFLKDGIMGEFAKKKIQECFGDIQDIEKDLEIEIKIKSAGKGITKEKYKEFNTCLGREKKVAALVAEPIIKKKLFLEIERVESELNSNFEETDSEIYVKEERKEKSRREIVRLLKDYSEEEIKDILKEISEEKGHGKNDKDSNI